MAVGKAWILEDSNMPWQGLDGHRLLIMHTYVINVYPGATLRCNAPCVGWRMFGDARELSATHAPITTQLTDTYFRSEVHGYRWCAELQILNVW